MLILLTLASIILSAPLLVIYGASGGSLPEPTQRPLRIYNVLPTSSSNGLIDGTCVIGHWDQEKEEFRPWRNIALAYHALPYHERGEFNFFRTTQVLTPGWEAFGEPEDPVLCRLTQAGPHGDTYVLIGAFARRVDVAGDADLFIAFRGVAVPEAENGLVVLKDLPDVTDLFDPEIDYLRFISPPPQFTAFYDRLTEASATFAKHRDTLQIGPEFEFRPPK